MPTIDLSQGGLLIIAIAWIGQLYHVLRGNKNITPFFIVSYMVGVLLLVISGYLANLPVSYFELGTLVAALIVLIAVLRKKR
jgi:uncharacterized protein with PQ loop repeat